MQLPPSYSLSGRPMRFVLALPPFLAASGQATEEIRAVALTNPKGRASTASGMGLPRRDFPLTIS